MAALGAAVVLFGTQPASATPGPIVQPLATTVTADALPTAQIDGVAWTQVVNGTTVYVGGKFTTARPAGAAAGVNTVSRNNLLAYDVTTGNLIASFNPNLNAQVKALALSPDGSTLYVGGQFTTVAGPNTTTVTRNRLAAYNTFTGALITTFAPNLDYIVDAIVATNTTVYAGGAFSKVGSTPRTRLAAFNASNGALVTAWNPSADSTVNAMTFTPDKSKIIIGGSFQMVNGVGAYGMAALDPNGIGGLLPWNTTSLIRDAGANSAILSLYADNDTVYGSGYVFGAGGNLEGSFAADPATGTIKWVEDCHGDTYGVYAAGGTVYTVSHDHYCGNIGGFPQTSPTWTFHRTLAYTKDVKGTANADPYGYYNYEGTPTPSLINWFPDLEAGSFTGQTQAAWTVSGSKDGNYVVEAGEFPTVNGTPQQGMVRFAVKPIAPSKQGPRLSGANFKPSLLGLGTGSVRVSWQANWDRDDHALTYKVVRNGNTASPIKTLTAVESTFWIRPTLGFIDTGLTPGATYSYRIYAVDPDGNQVAGDALSVVAPSTGAISDYGTKVLNDGASSYWPMTESGATFNDYAGFNDIDAGTGVTTAADGTISGSTTRHFDGTVNGTSSTRTAITAPNTFTLSTWVRTAAGYSGGGKIIGFGNAQAGNSSSYDRHVYLDSAGKVWFGVYPGGVQTLTSNKAVNDGSWHQVVATMSSAGMVLYVDGIRQASRTDVTTGQDYAGYWRIGGDNIGGWPNVTNTNLVGDIDQVAIFPNALSRQTIADEYTASGRTLAVPPVPADAYGAAVYNDDPDLYWRLGETTGTTVTDSGQYGQTGDFSGGITHGAAGAIKNTTDTATGFDGVNGLAVSRTQVNNPTVYSEEAWFKTTTGSGGKIIGFGNAQTGLSSGYDRHVYMQNDGTLVFGTYTGQLNTATSSASYNDGQWHQVVATQDSVNGMVLYVDGAVVATNGQTQAQNYAGYWRVGGDNTWGSSSAYFAGTIDDVSIYSKALTAGQVANHWSLGAGVVAPNNPPTAAFATSKTDLAVTVDGSGSTDNDGTVASYAWDFGDNGQGTTTGSGASETHTYSAAGTYTISLTVTDDDNATSAAVTHDVTVIAPNVAPTAAFTSTNTDLSVAFDGSSSTDTDGTVTSYAWDFGDTTSAAASPTSTVTHVYGAAGTYTVKLTITDDDGAVSSVPQSVTVTAANVLPTAAFTSSAANLVISFDASTSSDSDGTISSYAWDFDDAGTTGAGKTTSHTFTTAGTHNVKLTVTDNRNGTGTVTIPVTVSAANVSPNAAFTGGGNGLVLNVDGSTSNDPDGSVTKYAWDFGDTTPVVSGTSATASHTYAGSGTYTVTLTVTDNKNATGSVSHGFTVTAPGIVQPVVDNFGRTVANGWGTADVGGAWAVTGTNVFTVAGGLGKVTLKAAGSAGTAYLPAATSASNGTYLVDISADKVTTGSGIYAALIVRHTASGDYRITLRLLPAGVIQLAISKVVGTVSTTLKQVVVPGTFAANDVMRMKLVVSGTGGSTTLAGSAWKVGATPPVTAQNSVVDTQTELQAPGTVGFYGYLASNVTNAPTVLTVDNLSVTSA